MSLQGYWADQTSAALAALPSDLVVVLPVGAIEQHGPHLPLSVDRDLVEAVTARALAALMPAQNVLVLPTVQIGCSIEHDRFPGTLSLSGATLLVVLADLAASLRRSGVLRLVLFNGHGGNTAALEMAAREMRVTHGMIVATASWFGFAGAEEVFAGADLAQDLHAGLIETSAMLAARPELVEMDKARDFPTAMTGWAADAPRIGLSGQPARPAWAIGDLNREGACGNAAAATAEAGAQLLDTAGRGFAAFLAEFARFDHREQPL